jgi:hypothetical protein
VPDELAAAADAAAGGREHFGAWVRDLIVAAVRGSGFGAASNTQPYQEGWRAGWAEANKTFREALTDTLARVGRKNG